jgi:hypothetical protein
MAQEDGYSRTVGEYELQRRVGYLLDFIDRSLDMNATLTESETSWTSTPSLTDGKVAYRDTGCLCTYGVRQYEVDAEGVVCPDVEDLYKRYSQRKAVNPPTPFAFINLGRT